MSTTEPASRESVEPGFFQRVRQSLNWRIPRLKRKILGQCETQWARIVMDRETARFVSNLNTSALSALEISGVRWQTGGFKEYLSLDYPDYDVCQAPYKTEAYDIIFAEQVLEHVLWPYRAARHIYQMLRPGGIFIVTTPFLLRVHHCPVDCSRWTELGMKYLLAEAGFPLENITTGSWGNRACVRKNFREWTLFIPWLHSLRNEPLYPVVVWGFARKS